MPGSTYFSIRMRATSAGRHISGAEGLYSKENIDKAVKEYTSRALLHEKGMPDQIHISIDKIAAALIKIASLPLSTIHSTNINNAKSAAFSLLNISGISEDAVTNAFNLISDKDAAAGAYIMDKKGRLLQHGKSIRASRMGITKNASADLGKRLGRHGINSNRVKEALILASKAQNHPGVIGELCISDDPGYTTGYAASAKIGYVRIPNIKKKRSLSGGRVFFVDPNKMKRLLDYLKNEPVIINEISRCRGKIIAADIIKGYYKIN